MALLFNYSFNNINTAALPGALASVNGSPTVGAGDGPQGINTLHTNSSSSWGWIPNVSIPLNSQGLVVGAGFNVTSFGSNSAGLIAVGSSDAKNSVGQVSVNSDGSLSFINNVSGGSSPSSASGIFTFGNRHEVEVLFSSFATSGRITVYLDGLAVSGLTAVNVGSLALYSDGSNIHSVAVGGNGSGANVPTLVVMDSCYALDTTGSAPCNAHLGPAISIPQFPNGVGQESAWTPNGATPGWNCIHEVPPDGDTTYISDNNTNDEEAVTLTGPFGITGVYGVCIIADQRQDTAGGGRTIELGVGNGTARSYGTAWALGTSYKMDTTPFSSNPLTSAPWALADLSTLQVCAKLAS